MASRIRLSVLAGELGVPFVGLWRKFVHLFPGEVDDSLTVRAEWRDFLIQWKA